MAQVKQEPPTPGSVVTPKITSTTVVKRGKGRGKKAPMVSVLDTPSETGDYFIEVDEDDLEDSDSDATELYEILARPKHRRQDLFVNMVTMGSAIGATIPTTFGQTNAMFWST